MCRAIFSILLMLGGMVFTGTAEAAPCVADPVPGVIRDKWLALGGRDVIGCALTEERAVAGHDGRYVQFQNGQVVFIVEGCESNFLSSSDCDEGFSIPLGTCD